MGTKRNATLIKVRDADGAQCYRFGSNLSDVIWLTGPHRAQNVSLGDKGDLVYSSTGNQGRWTFYAYGMSADKGVAR